MKLSEILSLIAIVVGIIAAIAVVIATFRSNYAKTTVDILNGEVVALDRKVTRLEKSESDCKVELQTLKTWYDELLDKYNDLSAIVQDALKGQTSVKARAVRKQIKNGE